MTTTRINHTGHNHPNTIAARTACRKANATDPVLTAAVEAFQALTAHRKVRRDNNPTWRKLSMASMKATKAYADSKGITANEAADLVRDAAK